MADLRASVLKEYIIDALKVGLVPMVEGSPGVGKSAIALGIASQLNAKLIDLRLSQCDPTDLLGLPSVNGQGRATYAPMDTFPLEGDELPKGKNGWILFLDEFNSAPVSVQMAAYKLTLDRMVGQYHLHPAVSIICAGNKTTDGALVNRMSTANQSRLIHMELGVNTEDWVEWAQKNGIDSRITSYIQFRPSNLHKFDPQHNDKTFACPRTWEFLSRLIKDWDTIPSGKVDLLSGTVSTAVAREFVNFTKCYLDLPSISDIKSDPEGTLMPKQPSTLFALTGVLGDNADEDSSEPFLRYINRMSREFQVVAIKEMANRYPAVQMEPLFIEKVSEIADML